ncbi:MAG: hypothetical protein JXA68_11905, partial [Ignavibacteriales bacterium]|nr:hypothetical protein [Ignavibacteriales bacterium]
MENFSVFDTFEKRHIGPNQKEIDEMINTIGVKSVGELIDKTVPKDIRSKDDLILDSPLTE